MAKRKRKGKRRSGRRAVRGLDFVKALGGDLMTCQEYGVTRGKKGRVKGKSLVRCLIFERGGSPPTAARKRAGVEKKYKYSTDMGRQGRASSQRAGTARARSYKKRKRAA